VGQPAQKVSEILSQKTSWAWWSVLVFPAVQVVELGRLRSKSSKNMRLYLRNN
jgi:hypothetical protein